MQSNNSDKQDTREAILNVAMPLFAEQGFSGVAMRQVASGVGVSLPTIYHHFGNKELLFDAVEAKMFGSHAKSLIRDLREPASPEVRLRKFMKNMLQNFEKNPVYFKLVQRNLIEANDEKQRFLVELTLQHLFDELRDLLNELQAGSGNDIRPIMIFSAMVGFQTMRPALRFLKGYKYAKSKYAQERDQFIDTVVIAARP